MTTRTVETGQHVWLRENPEEGWPREAGIVEGVDKMPWGLCVTIRLDEEFRQQHTEEWGERDDGIREVTMDQLDLGDDEEAE